MEQKSKHSVSHEDQESTIDEDSERERILALIHLAIYRSLDDQLAISKVYFVHSFHH